MVAIQKAIRRRVPSSSPSMNTRQDKRSKATSLRSGTMASNHLIKIKVDSNKTRSKVNQRVLVLSRRDLPKEMREAMETKISISPAVHLNKAHRNSRASQTREPNIFEI